MMKAKFINESIFKGPSEDDVYENIKKIIDESEADDVLETLFQEYVIDRLDYGVVRHGDDKGKKEVFARATYKYIQEHGMPDGFEYNSIIVLGALLDESELIDSGIDMMVESMSDLVRKNGKLYLHVLHEENLKPIIDEKYDEAIISLLSGDTMDIFLGARDPIAVRDFIDDIWDDVLPVTQRFIAEEVLPEYSPLEIDGEEVPLNKDTISVEDDDIIVKHNNKEYKFSQLIQDQEELESLRDDISKSWTTAQELADEQEAYKDVKEAITKYIGPFHYDVDGLYIQVDDLLQQIISELDVRSFEEPYNDFVTLLEQSGIQVTLNEPRYGYMGEVDMRNFHEELVENLS